MRESPDTDITKLEQILEDAYGTHRLVINVYRSRYRFPPQLTRDSRLFLEQLYDLHDYELFEIEGL